MISESSNTWKDSNSPVKPLSSLKKSSLNKLGTIESEPSDNNEHNDNLLPLKPTLRPIPTRELSQAELYNSFFKVNENFDVHIDRTSMQEAIEYRTSKQQAIPITLIPSLVTSPIQPTCKISPLNVQLMEKVLIKEGQHHTFHTDSKLLKEFNGYSKPHLPSHTHCPDAMWRAVTDAERLSYEDYSRTEARPVSFVSFLVNSRWRH